MCTAFCFFSSVSGVGLDGVIVVVVVVVHLLVLPFVLFFSFSLSRVFSGCKNIATIRASNIAPRARAARQRRRKGAREHLERAKEDDDDEEENGDAHQRDEFPPFIGRR